MQDPNRDFSKLQEIIDLHKSVQNRIQEETENRVCVYHNKKLQYTLGPWNCFNPRIAFKLLYPETEESYLPLLDDDKYQIPDDKDIFIKRLNKEYFKRLDSLFSAFEIDNSFEQLKSLFEFKKILSYYNNNMDLYYDMLQGCGFFKDCKFYHINGELAKLYDSNFIIMNECFVSDYADTTFTAIKSFKIPLEDFLREKWSKQMDIITEGSASIAGIDFRNPWRQALEKEFSEKTIENAERLLRVMKDISVNKIVESEKSIHPKEIIELAKKAGKAFAALSQYDCDELLKYVKNLPWVHTNEDLIRALLELNCNMRSREIEQITNIDGANVRRSYAWKNRKKMIQK